jgi:hypothetical protein
MLTFLIMNFLDIFRVYQGTLYNETLFNIFLNVKWRYYHNKAVEYSKSLVIIRDYKYRSLIAYKYVIHN